MPVILNLKEGEFSMNAATKILTAVALAGFASIAVAETTVADFQGYWMGTDPLDGGDTRRGLTVNPNPYGETPSMSMAGRDSFVSTCGGTDRAFVSFNDAEIVNEQLVAESATLHCFDTDPQKKGDQPLDVTLGLTYELLEAGVMIETVTVGGNFLTEAVFFRVNK
jgi:hypothetical protein